ncbi:MULTISPECIES: DUF2059 domain-containing protein [Chryseobacterium]|uniref:DUF2059 domain-containing protein n=1 Tax=Chryseobacterium camelliae TaxID=1265445 RepID=A0ABU0TFF8_9FLAO|nr:MULTISPECIES: DUF2059 domain-containing protein [Chryseobacterium]MDT3407348.1 hypothetical protein [Pseudacidovorax intermedius]MDQ1094863.1 hypothetical protein [Chryseobacterium camelliae]MDQ1098803.1 hypothetical protein [Chryseobacterium sp. SORGH_AS_1048]MDR6086154.1 hypothetical protein [Chryseobacterium sp. SORGH_AS_0909]MDR6130524.1 hypothetical protein [Chryseobacterium sp. SORGH_AS_1175]
MIEIKKIILLVMFSLGTLTYSQTKHDKVKELITLNGTFPLSKEVEKQVISNYKKKYSHVPESAWVPIEKKINIDTLIQQVTDIYEKRFSEKEIDELLIFYKSEVGKKIIKNSPEMISEIQKASADWAMKVTETINDDLEKKGYLQSPPPPMQK